MIKERDRVVVIKDSISCEYRFAVKKNEEYIVRDTHKCTCGMVGYDIGLPWSKTPISVKCKCDCGEITSPDSVPYYDSALFRKVEEQKQYQVVEITSEIKKQKEELILN